MIEIQIKTENRKTNIHYGMTEETQLEDIAMVLLELNKIQRWLLDESEKYEPIVDITTDKKLDEFK
jgi:hypothetical protein